MDKKILNPFQCRPLMTGQISQDFQLQSTEKLALMTCFFHFHSQGFFQLRGQLRYQILVLIRQESPFSTSIDLTLALITVYNIQLMAILEGLVRLLIELVCLGCLTRQRLYYLCCLQPLIILLFSFLHIMWIMNELCARVICIFQTYAGDHLFINKILNVAQLSIHVLLVQNYWSALNFCILTLCSIW